jgi:hypothetical protein
LESIVTRPLQAILDDLLRSIGLKLRILDEAAIDDTRYESFQLVTSGGVRTGVLVARDQTDPERLVSVAEQIQEFVHEELSRLGQPASWPSCPEHPHNHPLAPGLLDQIASWRCPASGTVAGRIGFLPTLSAT